MAITMRDVAKEAGVSVATVSYVLSGRQDQSISQSTRDEVVRAAQQLKYRYNALAANLRRGATRAVGIQVYPLEVPILARKVAALERALRAAGYFPFLCHVTDPDAEQMFFDACARREACGIVLTAPPRAENRRSFRSLIADGVVVVSAEPVPDLPVPYVTVDRGGGMEIAVRHLFALGHRRVAMVEGFGGQDRPFVLEAYRRALTSEAVAFEPELVLYPEWGLHHYEVAERAVERLWSLPEPPTALLTTDDQVAVGALWSLRRRALRVPEDVALVGCDDIPMAAYAEVPLTTLAQPAEEQGSRLAQLFLDGLRDPKRIAECRIVLPLHLVVRESCGAARMKT